MALVNHAKKEINAKLVYYGPAGSGKAAALHYIYSRIKPSLRGDLKKIPAGGDSLLFFDFSPFEVPMADGYRLRLHVYTLTGQVANPATWKMTLKGADGLVIMVDPAPEHVSQARESVSELRTMLSAYGVGLKNLPAVLQMNFSEKATCVDEASKVALALDLPHIATCCSNVNNGEGVLDVLTKLSRLVLERVAEADSRLAVVSGKTKSVEGGYDELEEVNESSFKDEDEVCHAMPEGEDSQNSAYVLPTISVSSNDVGAYGRTLRIPVDISCGDVCRRLVVTISVDSL